MASYHLQINTGAKGAALEHAQYIDRDGRFTEERYGAVEARGHANFPAWAREDRNAFWKASDEFERVNGNTYREYELALPRELSDAERVALVEQFASQELGSTRVYQWAIHNGRASDGGEQPHVHLMFSDRQIDGIERGAEQFFKRYNSKNPERGGARKATYGADKEEAALVYEGIRERWATVQNRALEMAGVEARVDHRSLAAQGIRTREPGLHRGPAVSGIEARGEVSEVGRRQREQRLERAQERKAVVSEVRVVTREELALERVAVRERRELAQEATGEDRQAVLKRVEADRREQIERAQAVAERRVERRQGMGIGGRLLAQARALRERIGQQLGRVKEWIAERFPDPLQRLKDRSRDLFDSVVEKAQRALGREVGQEPTGGNTPGRKRGMFDGLQLGAVRSAGTSETFSEVRLSVPESRSDRPAAGEALDRSIDRFARAWTDAMRMQEKGLPVLAHQLTELGQAGEALDRLRPGGSQDLLNTIRYEQGSGLAMHKLEGPARVAQLRAGIEHEERIRRDPNLGAERLVKEWNGLEARRDSVRGDEHRATREQLQERARELTQTLKRDPQLEGILKQRSRELGIAPGSRLAQILHERDLKRALSLSDLYIGRHRGLSL